MAGSGGGCGVTTVWRDGRLIESTPGTAPVEAGWGAFTTVGCDGGHPLLWTRHRSRLAASLRFLGAGNDVTLPDESALRELLRAGGLDGAARLRVVGRRRRTLARISHHLATTAGDMPQSATFSRFGVLDVLSSTTPRPSGRKRHISRHLAGLATRRGEICGRGWTVEASASVVEAVGPDAPPARLSLQRWRAAPTLAGHKTLARLPWDMARELARREGADDALLVDEEGRVLETAIANVWLCRGHDLRTPPAPERCLPGIMRGWLFENAAALGLQALECDLSEADLLGADELWISNAVGGVRRVASVAGREWRSWPFFERLILLGVPAPGW